MDLMASCKDKLAYFRVKELKDVLQQLGASKQGKKQDLIERILKVIADDRVSGSWAKKNNISPQDVAKLVDDTYRKMQVPGATELASKSQGVSESSSIRFKEEPEESYQIEKVRCPCGSSLQNETTIKCEDPKCGVWQHIGCVVIPEKSGDCASPVPPETFYCELCRLSRADPFWVTIANPLYPVKLLITSIPADGSNPVQSIEKTFQLTRADKDLLSKQEYDVQAWCMLLNDKVPFRMQWPQYADLQVNGVPVRAINRPGSQLLGANGRDDGPIITPCTRDGINKISLTGCDARVFCLGVRIVKRRTVQHIMNLIPKEAEGERFEDAVARVRRCVGGGNATEAADSDSDLEVVADFIPVNLRCPMSGSRMKVAGRFKPCVHMGCFDLEVFVEMNMRSRKWQCPICLKNYCLDNIIIDPYFNCITTKLRSFGEEVNEIEVKPDGSWRAKSDGDRRALGDLWLWHAPDGSLSVSMEVDSKTKPDVPKQIKQEAGSDGHPGLKLGMKKNRNGVWEISKPEDMQTFSSGNKLQEEFYPRQNIIPMSSSATGSGKDGEDASVNQDGAGNLDYSTANGIELDSMSLNIDPNYGYNGRNSSVPLGDPEVIVLSDSEEENEPIVSSGPVYNNLRSDGGGVSYPVAPRIIPDHYSEDPVLNTGVNGPFHTNDDDLMQMWSLLPSGSQTGAGFQLFGSDGDVSDALVDMPPSSAACPSSINGYTLAGETAMGSAAFVPESSSQHPHGNISEGLVDNPLAFNGNDPSLQIFLPTRPTDASAQAEFRDQPDLSNGIHTEDWISLSLGGSSGGVNDGTAAAGGINTGQQSQSKQDGALDSLAEASLLLGMNGNKSAKVTRERSDSPFTFPRQRRSVRPRLYLSIDSDSE
ncbi:OLC1v1004016C1 [Oldenlandia corymbosa var. corymbosa]|uniref:OLC1v1004016C1 n=1 Tax=Oldenlandia corymbosa var. corymbosa TaxID=529605 RepID=A0AAV1DD63_OLDCO|nr:OLC1v1004016C1 [Oldenlandia corymbosa var. corymbosa]